MSLTPASQVYTPETGHQIIDAEPTEHYQTWGYSIGYEQTLDGQPVPEGGNTAIFCIEPGGMTEPVFVTKTDPDATFSVEVLQGSGVCLRATSHEVQEVPLHPGEAVVIEPNWAYVYKNTGDEPLILHDVALPAYQSGDDVEITSSYRLATVKPFFDDANSSSLLIDQKFNVPIIIELPNGFWERVLVDQEPPAID